MSKRMKIAVQNSGRLTKPSLGFLADRGLEFKINGRKLMVSCDNLPVDILFTRSGDIPEYVQSGIIDFGIVGENVIRENNYNVTVVKQLGFAPCALVIAVPKNSAITDISQLCGERIATSYPNLLTAFLKRNKITASIVTVRGAVEATPALNLVDAICDITQTGTTLRENNLVPLATMMESQAVLITNPNSSLSWKF